MPKKVSTVSTTSSASKEGGGGGGASSSSKLFITEHPLDGPVQQQQRVQLTLDAHLKTTPPAEGVPPPQSENESDMFCMVVEETQLHEGTEDGVEEPPNKGQAFTSASLEDKRRTLEEVARKNALQRRDMAIAKLHIRRSENLLRQVGHPTLESRTPNTRV
jgi:hypothetical protein